jgi:plastocyanin
MDFNISASPAKQYIKPGGLTSFSINLSSYLWYLSDGNGTLSTPRYAQGITLSPIPNTVCFNPSYSSYGQAFSQANLTVSTTSTISTGLYPIDVIGTAAAGNLTHQTTVQLAVGNDLSVTCTPGTVKVDTEGTATFNVDVSEGIRPYTYQWYDSKGPLSGKTAQSLSVKESMGDYTYYCLVTDDGGQTKESNRVTLTVTPKTDLLVVHATVDSNVIAINQSATFTLDVLTGGTIPYSYKWLDSENSAILGVSPSLVVTKDREGNYTYYCLVTDDGGQTKESNRVTITVTSTTPKLIAHASTSSSSVSVNQKTTLSLDVLTGGIPPYSYQWIEDGVGVVGIDSEFVLNKDVTGNYSYYCLISDNSGQTLETNRVTLAVVPGSDFWVSILPYLVFVIMAVIIIVIVIQRRKKLKKEIESLPLNPMEDWQYFECPTSGMKPGTVFRVTKDNKVEKVVTLEPPKYDIEIEEEDEVLGEIDRNIKMSTFIGFTGLGVADLGGKLNNTQTFTLDLPGLKKESTNDFNLIGLENKLISSKTFAAIFQDDDRYFIITKARKAKQIKYVLDNTQVNNFGGEAKVKELALRGKHLNYEKGDRSINQTFDQYMRVAFYAKQLNLKKDKSGKVVRKS